MRQTASVALATWMLEHFTPRPYSGALSGDLLEELDSGRSAGWYWRQVISAIAAGLLSRARRYALPLTFSVAWSVFYPAWQISLWRGQSAQALFSRWSALDWPYSALLLLGSGMFPAVTFVWLGLFVFVVLRTKMQQGAQELSGLRVLGSLSLSLNVLLLATIGLLGWSGPAGIQWGREIFYASPHPPALSVPLALSLFASILAAQPPLRSRQSATSSRA